MRTVASISIDLQKLNTSSPPRSSTSDHKRHLLEALSNDVCNKPVSQISKSNPEAPKTQSLIPKQSKSVENSKVVRIQENLSETKRVIKVKSRSSEEESYLDGYGPSTIEDYFRERYERAVARIREDNAKIRDLTEKDEKTRNLLEERRKTMTEGAMMLVKLPSHMPDFNLYSMRYLMSKLPAAEKRTRMLKMPLYDFDENITYIVDNVRDTAYFKTEFLGRGGFGHVFLITDAKDRRQYACKIIPKDHRIRKFSAERVAHEILIHLELNHVNVVRLHHYFQCNFFVYIIMEACPQKSLSHMLKQRGKVTEPEARYYMKQMVTGVAYIHSQNIIHRDLKPSNMLLTNYMILKIGDFGLATKANSEDTRVSICGTPNYIAPEVLCKRSCSFESDVWALGCILYTLLLGQPPFDSNSLKETYSKICKVEYTEPDDTVAGKNCRDLIKWLLQAQPELRPSLEKDVKQHAYLTQEYVPRFLPRTCFYEPPTLVANATGNQEAWHSYTHTNTLPNPQPQTLCTQQLQQYQQTLNRSDKTMQKKSKVSSWIMRKLPRLPRFRQRLTNVLCPEYKKMDFVPQSVQMNRALEACVSEMKHNNVRNPPTVEDVSPLFVIKWIDYSNKYGLSFQLSDKSVGVLFNDNTKISYTSDRRTVEYMITDDELTRYHRERDVPVLLQKKLELLRRFTEYMDEYLTEGGEIKGYNATRQSKKACVPRMRRWLRTDKAIVMELTVPLLQVNFFVDHTKMVVSQEFPGRDYLITYIDTGRHTSSYWLNDLRNSGCTPDLYERLRYVCEVTQEFAELDSNMSV